MRRIQVEMHVSHFLCVYSMCVSCLLALGVMYAYCSSLKRDSEKKEWEWAVKVLLLVSEERVKRGRKRGGLCELINSVLS